MVILFFILVIFFGNHINNHIAELCHIAYCEFGPKLTCCLIEQNIYCRCIDGYPHCECRNKYLLEF